MKRYSRMLYSFFLGTVSASIGLACGEEDTGEHREMLIDRRNDPGEMTNLIGDPAYDQVAVTMRSKLSKELRSRGIAARMPY